jgi:hypothetical protein
MTYLSRKWHIFTSTIWFEGYQIGADRAKKDLLREIRKGLDERSLKTYKSKHLQLGYLHAQEAMLEILHEIESR